MRVSSLISRRNFVRLGLGLAGGQLLSPPAVTAAPVGRRRAKQVRLLIEQGGVSQLDTWDPKTRSHVTAAIAKFVHCGGDLRLGSSARYRARGRLAGEKAAEAAHAVLGRET